MFNIGLLCMEQGRVQEAANWYRKAVARKPSSAEALFQFGTALTAQGASGRDAKARGKGAQQIAIEEEEKKRAEDEREAKKAAELPRELGNLTKEDYRAQHDLPNEPVHHPSPPGRRWIVSPRWRRRRHRSRA